MLLLKGCPKCHGDMSLEHDADSRAPLPELACVMCGFREDVAIREGKIVRGVSHALPFVRERGKGNTKRPHNRRPQAVVA